MRLSKRWRSWTCLLLLALSSLLLTGCDEMIENSLCRSAADKVCSKWFSCWPVIAAASWGDEDNCQDQMHDWCTSSDDGNNCDLDNSELRACRDGIDDSPCGSLPSSCYNLLDCYGQAPPN